MEVRKHLVRAGKALLVSVLLTAALLLIMALILYKTDLSGIAENIMVVILYLAACLAGGFVLGRQEEKKRFLWGAGFGVLYFLLLMLVSALLPAGETSTVQTELQADWPERIRVLLLCCLGGMVGGMLS